MSKKEITLRVDQLLVQKGLAPSRERAQALVLAGVVFVGEKKVQKSSEKFFCEADLKVKGEDHPYVSRGGVKLEGALKDFEVSVQGKVCLDIGASTGGFTDCLLQKGAKKVYAMDVGYGQLAWKLRQDPRVILRERFNIRHLQSTDLPETVDLIVMDVSFISLTKVLPVILKTISYSFSVLALIKPQFELSPAEIPKGGVVKDPLLHQKAIDQVLDCLKNFPVEIKGVLPSHLTGTDGNQEFLSFFDFKF